MTEILLLGSFHFLESEIDFYSDTIQKQLSTLSDTIIKFRPTKIAVEAPPSSQDAVNDSYEKLQLSDFSNLEKMKTSELGKIRCFRQEYPTTYNNEAIQIGYRIGKMMGHKKIFAIDDDTIIDDDGISRYFSNTQFKRLGEIAKKFEYSGPKDDLISMLSFYNSKEWSLNNQQLYLLKNEINVDSTYNGSEYASKWYKRNLRIFSNIQALCTDCERLFIVYGAGHLETLRYFINANEGMKLANTNDYLSCML